MFMDVQDSILRHLNRMTSFMKIVYFYDKIMPNYTYIIFYDKYYIVTYSI
jgi:hypothetical protein